MNSYIGHHSQVSGIEEHRLVGGKGDGMRLYELHTEGGLDMVFLPDRNGDIARLRYKGINLSYMSPCGYVAPAYYENKGSGWLSSFTAGFLTTCGLQNVGTPNSDNGEELPLHGSIGNIPCEQTYWTESEDSFAVHTLTRDETIFARKLTLERTVTVSKKEARFTIEDLITNTGDQKTPFEILYHMNMGYPLLDEESIITIPSSEVRPRNDHAADDIENWMHMERPTAGYEERCYYHTFPDEKGFASIRQPKLDLTLEISYDAKELDGFVEWKMMGVRDYVLGLECGNSLPDGRDVMRKTGMLKFLKPGEQQKYRVDIAVK
ncbi:MAG: aldose 1-epimerase family protein [Lachnospiraceae bacterium]|nr:aldose 1-epimerase family protein [Lachnospiraceae bacterium]